MENNQVVQIEDIFIKHKICEEELYFMYKGEMTHEVKKMFTHMAEQKCVKEKVPDKITRRVFHVLVECLENINKHSDDFEDSSKLSGKGFFLLGENGTGHYVICGNKIKSGKTNILKASLEKLNNADKDELLEMHKSQIQRGELSEKGGAGLGLIDIVKKTKNPIDYHFHDLGDGFHFFIVKITVNK
ncbi:MAG: hypothetical protein HC896_09120 [Bacteroidales bacterium]|nr:hypothetical protein [Bacteroidales bacterium]